MKLQLATLVLILLVSCASYKKGGDLWTAARIPDGMPTDSLNLPNKYQVFQFEVDMLRNALNDVGTSENESLLVQLPDPDNNVGPFKVWQSSVITKQMARKYPDLIAYKGFRTSDINTKIRMEVPQSGMQVMVTSGAEVWFISPIDAATGLYMVYHKDDLAVSNKFWEGKVE